MSLHHASCVEFEGKGVVIFGPSGSGKSDLALRLIDAGGELVSDDYVEIASEGDILYAHPAPNIAGMIEVRGVGLIKLAYKQESVLGLALKLVCAGKIERLPEHKIFSENSAEIPLYEFDAFSASAIAKIRLILRTL
jgi:HPr kinase/phosphorylase|tara:strand:- start:51324 stop:51734 length:411 start_codon:yes stop_codon:yes gene_type:complete